jgi:ribose/xylose/arabinose/galactoside ABC-type transport system permease subunit
LDDHSVLGLFFGQSFFGAIQPQGTTVLVLILVVLLFLSFVLAGAEVEAAGAGAEDAAEGAAVAVVEAKVVPCRTCEGTKRVPHVPGSRVLTVCPACT